MSKSQLTVVYVAGFGRSCSTLLSQAIAQVPGTLAIGEMRNLWTTNFRENQRCSCGTPFNACEVWSEAVTGLKGTTPLELGPEFSRVRRYVERCRYVPGQLTGLAPKKYRQALRQYCETREALYRKLADLSGARVLVETSKAFVSALPLLRMRDIDVRFLHLVRDSRGVAYSWTKKRERVDIEGEKLYMVRRPPSRTAGMWLVRNMAVNILLPLLARKKYMRIRYEDFAADPAPVLESVLRFASLPQEELNFIKGKTLNLSQTTHVAFGNPWRFNAGPVTLKLDESWRQRLPPPARRRVTAVTWPLLLYYGYLGNRT